MINLETISSQELINSIYNFRKEKNAFDIDVVSLIIEFCDFHELDYVEVGKIIKEDEEYVKVLEDNLKTLKYIQTKEEDDILPIQAEEW